MVALLHGTIADTYKEPPPGVTPKQIAERRAELEALLAAVEHDQHLTRLDHADLQAARWRQAHDQQVAHEHKIIHDGERKDERSRTRMHEFRQEQRERFDELRTKLLANTTRSFQHLDSEQQRRIDQARAELDRRDEQLQHLADQRAAEKAELRRRQLAAEEHAEDMIRRRDERQRAKQLEQERVMKEHRRLAEERAERVQAEKDRRAAEVRRRQHTAESKKANLLDHAKRVERYRELEGRRGVMIDSTLQMVKEERDEYLAKRRDVRARIESNHESEVDRRMRRQQEDKFRRERASVCTDETKTRKALLLEEASVWKTLTVNGHLQMRELRLQDRHNSGHRKVFNRWTRKAGVIADVIHHSPAFRAATAQQQHAAAATPSRRPGSRGGHMPGGRQQSLGDAVFHHQGSIADADMMSPSSSAATD